MNNFFSELKRRNVYKVAVAYAVVSWLLIQAASILFPTFEAPPWVMKVFVAVVALGFPVALVLAWAFELTPEGIKRAEDVLPNESITRKTGRKLVGLTIALTFVAAGLLVFQFTPARFHTLATAKSAPSSAVPEKSIAVLPFENQNRDSETEYLCDGIPESTSTAFPSFLSLR